MKLLLLLGTFWGALPIPDYEEALLAEAEQEIDLLISRGLLEEADRYLAQFREHVSDDARLMYSHGLTKRLIGELEPSQLLLEQALGRDPTLAEAWYDLGEVHLNLGRPVEAESAFQKAAQLSKHHPNGWAAPFRLAELAGARGNTAAFEGWLEEAMQRGFLFQQIVWGSEKWTNFLSDPELGDIMKRLITVHESESILDSWPQP
ncbi:MAG: tetratricopeptide repeat protein [Myxococcota bacterium]|nr:tetratricopeptide repeat protein [Myxococcota bacterium]